MKWENHPQPSFCRKRFLNLNGEWLLNGKHIIVPFCPEAEASEYAGEIGYGKKDCLVYEKMFTLPEDFLGENDRVLLHFDGVDQAFIATIGNVVVGSGRDGYTKKVFDVTDRIDMSRENTLKVIATDTLSHVYPYGKQKRKRGGMWYTPASGIWKSVWLECVPENRITNLKIDTTLDSLSISMNFEDFIGKNVELCISPACIKCDDMQSSDDTYAVRLEITHENAKKCICIDLKELVSTEGKPFSVKNWTPDEPWIYDMEITAGSDRVNTYFALRTISEGTTESGLPCICLNGKQVFLHGVLDQGYFTKSLYLPPEEEDYKKDIMRMKELGFNLLRKHIKTEADLFYYYADICGMMIMQDFVNSGPYRYIIDTVLPTIGIFVSNDRIRFVSKARRSIFEKHVNDVSDELHNHPSVIAYTIFNEGWGQHRSDSYYRMLKEKDPSRLYDSTSGWFRGKMSDFDSRHIYFRLRDIKPLKKGPKKPIFVTECGGYSFPVAGHMHNEKAKYGYGTYDSAESLTAGIEKLYREMIIPGKEKGVCGCIYTQLSDVEDEINGIYTYDREILKVDPDRIRALSEEVKRVVE